MRFRRRTVQAPTFGPVQLGSLFRESVGQFVGDLNAVGIPNHVVVKHHAAHPRQLHATRLQGTPPSFFESFGTGHNVTAHPVPARIMEPSV